MFNRIVLFKFYDRSELVQLRGKIYFTKYTLCSVGSLSTKSTRCLVIRMVMVMNVVAAEVSRRAPGALRSAP